MSDLSKQKPDLGIIGAEAENVSLTPDIKTLTEHSDFQNEQIERLKDDRNLRNKYSKRVYWFMLGWSVFVGLVTLLHGFGLCGFQLPDIVMATLVGSTTISVLGLVGFVVKGLFPSRGH